LPVSRWHEQIGDPTVADGILDRLVQYCHWRKMDALNLAVFFLVKIQDLVVRLLFESIGEAIIKVYRP
jgi:hypothetical protein